MPTARRRRAAENLSIHQEERKNMMRNSSRSLRSTVVCVAFGALLLGALPAAASASPATWNTTGTVASQLGATLKLNFAGPSGQQVTFDCTRPYMLARGTTANAGSPLNGTLAVGWQAPVQYDCARTSTAYGICTVLPNQLLSLGTGSASQVGGIYTIAFPAVPTGRNAVSCSGLVGALPNGGASIVGTWSNATSSLTVAGQALGLSSTGWAVTVDAFSKPLSGAGGSPQLV